jgi:hypothetical protein
MKTRIYPNIIQQNTQQTGENNLIKKIVEQKQHIVVIGW